MNRTQLLDNFFSRDEPRSDAKRSLFPYKQPIRNGYMVGGFYPLGKPQFVAPNDGYYDLKIDGVLKSGSALVFPPLDDAYVDFIAVWVPMRIVWEHYAQFLGANDTKAWTQTNTYQIPHKEFNPLSLDNMSSVSCSNYYLEPHFGLPYKARTGIEISVLEHRAYYAVWNHLIRDPNWQRPVLYSVGDVGSQGEFGYEDLWPDYDIYDFNGDDIDVLSGLPFGPAYPGIMPCNRFHNWNTTMLPEPQAGDPAELDLLGDAPVYKDSTVDLFKFTNIGTNQIPANNVEALSMINASAVGVGATGTADLYNEQGFGGLTINKGSLKTDLSAVTAFNINQLRETVLMQIFKEKLARSGQRINDIIRVFWGVSNPGVNHDLPELLCHKRFKIGINQVVATADSANSNASSHLGDTGAYSLTVIHDTLFSKSFTEHGYIVYGMMIRTADSSASQGIHPQFLMKDKFDMPWTVFDHIGETKVLADYINAESDFGLTVGYQEAWWWRRTQIAVNGGPMNPAIPDAMNYATFAKVFDKFTSESGIGPSFFIQTPDEFDRVLVANHNVSPQFLGDFIIHGTFAATMSPHSTPFLFGARV